MVTRWVIVTDKRMLHAQEEPGWGADKEKVKTLDLVRYYWRLLLCRLVIVDAFYAYSLCVCTMFGIVVEYGIYGFVKHVHPKSYNMSYVHT